jgi:hypothetical protein
MRPSLLAYLLAVLLLVASDGPRRLAALPTFVGSARADRAGEREDNDEWDNEDDDDWDVEDDADRDDDDREDDDRDDEDDDGDRDRSDDGHARRRQGGAAAFATDQGRIADRFTIVKGAGPSAGRGGRVSRSQPRGGAGPVRGFPDMTPARHTHEARAEGRAEP